MYVVKFCRAPSHLWVGVVEYNGGHVYATGKTMDNLMHRMKQSMSINHHVSARQLVLDTKQSDTYEFEKLYKPFMSPIFVGRYWRDKGQPKYDVPELATAPALVKSNKEYVTETIGDELVVFELKEVARYSLHKTCVATEPVCQDKPESQEEKVETFTD